MRKTILTSVLVLVLLITFVPFSNAQMAKEGSTSGRSTWITNFTLLPMGQERVQISYEGYGVSLSDTREGILHNASAYVVGSAHSFKGRYEDDSGFVRYTRPDGDQIFMTYKCAGEAGKTGKGTYTFVGGTGKFVGLQGSGEFTRFMLRPPKKGVGASLNISKGSWKIVEPKK
jgi:hypothetical protein